MSSSSERTCLAALVVFCIGVAAVYMFPPNKFCCHDFINERRHIFSQYSFSSKTGYSFDAPLKNESSINGCEATKIYAVLRHGTRMPGKSHIKRFSKVFGRVSMLSNTSELVKNLKTWSIPFSIETEGQLTVTGMREQYCLAQRFKSRFPNLFNERYSPDGYNFKSTYKERCVQSALSFGHGLFHESDPPLHGYEPIGLKIDSQNDNLLRFFDDCEHYQKTTINNKTLSNFIDGYLRGQSMKRVTEEVQNKLDPGYETWNISVNEVLDMYQICAMETSIYGNSHWCRLFDEKALQVLEYYFDLKAYWLKGYGRLLNWHISCPLIDDVINSFTVSIHNTSKVMLRFAHAETLIPLACALGLKKDDHRLMPDKFEAKRKFHVNKIAPFSGSIAFVLYECHNQNKDDVSHFVHILSNEVPVNFDHPYCKQEDNGEKERGGNWCPLNKLKEIFLSPFPHCSLHKLCTTNV